MIHHDQVNSLKQLNWLLSSSFVLPFFSCRFTGPLKNDIFFGINTGDLKGLGHCKNIASLANLSLTTLSSTTLSNTTLSPTQNSFTQLFYTKHHTILLQPTLLTRNFVMHNSFAHNSLTQTSFAHSFVTTHLLTSLNPTLSHTTLSHVLCATLSHTHTTLSHCSFFFFLHNLSSTMSFIRPAFPISFTHLFRADWKKLTRGLKGPLFLQCPYASLLAIPINTVIPLAWPRNAKDMNVCWDVSQATFLRSGVLHQGRGCNCKEWRTLSRTAREGVICWYVLWVLADAWIIMDPNRWPSSLTWQASWGLVTLLWAKAVPWSWQPRSELCKLMLSLVQHRSYIRCSQVLFKRWLAATCSNQSYRHSQGKCHLRTTIAKVEERSNPFVGNGQRRKSAAKIK